MKLKNKRKTFFTSDLHFGDDRLNLYGRDLLFKSSKEVDEHIVKRWNEFVDPKDLVIVVGDVSVTRDGFDNLLKCNGEKWLIKGNYDIEIKDGGTAKYEINDKMLSKYFSKILDSVEVEIGDEKVFVNHFPTKTKKEQFNICGHIHGLWKVQRNAINVGVDAWHFTPVSEDLIKFQMGGIKNHYDQNVYAGELVSNIENRNGCLKILRAPEYSEVATFEESEDIVIFLAGPAQGCENWQEYFINELEKKLKEFKTNKNIIICSPRRLEKPKNFVYEEQVDWESHYLNRASLHGFIVFWLAKETEKIEGRSFARTTRVEIGEWFAKGQKIPDFKMLVGCDSGFDGKEYIEFKLKTIDDKFKFTTNKKDMVDEILKQIKKM
jgi:calcineurin-like phosphoesterase family protein